VSALTQELTNYMRHSLAGGRIGPAVTAAAREWSRRRALAPRALAVDVSPAAAVVPAPVRPAAPAAHDIRWPSTWSLDTGDPEIAWLPHRFGWAVEAAVSAGPAAATRLAAEIRAWRARAEAADDRVWDSYSISERMANWSLAASVLAARGETSLVTDAAFRAVVDEHARRLSARLEDYGEGYTNNHSLNNARALYWYGAMWGAPAVRAAAGRLAADRAASLFTPSGFLRESSSHYHVLLTRALLEIVMLARAAKDDATLEAIRGAAARALERAVFLMAGGRLPLIGDVSPDAPPSWTMGITTLAAEAGVSIDDAVGLSDAGWHSLWTDRAGTSPALPSPRAVSFADAGWHRVSKNGWDVLAHVNPDGAVGPRSHGHIDLGGFELAHHGRPIVVDRGLAKRGASAWDARIGASHSTITVDGYEPMLAWGVNGYPSAMDRAYWDPRARAETADGRLDIVHHAFARIAAGCGAERRILVAPARATIEDTLSNVDGRTIDLFIQIDPSLTVTSEGGVFRLTGGGVSARAAWMVAEGDVIAREVEATSHAPEYGVEVPASRLHLRVRGRQATRATLTVETAAA